MKIGVAYPTQEIGSDPDAVRPFIRAMEDLDYDHLMVHDHVVKASHADRHPKLTGRWTEKHSFQDPFVLMGYAAAVSAQLEFATGVLILPQRQTAVVAQQAADVDLLSKERLRLGVGIGWNYVEYQALGQDFHTRGKRLEEQIDLLRRLWSTPLVTFDGRFDRIDRAGINPRPKRIIPVWLGGYAEAAFARGARLGDGFIFARDIMESIASWSRVKFHLQAHGRPAEGYGSDLLTLFAKGAVETADYLKRWRDAGGTHASVSSVEHGLGNNVNAHMDFIAKVKALVSVG